MEVIGSASSIIAVVQIAGSIAKLCGGYISDVKDASQDIERLQQKAATLRDVLQKLIEAGDVTNRKPLHLSNEVTISIKRCSQDLARLQKKLQPKAGHKAMSRVGLRALKWPLSKASMNDDVIMIEGYLAVFNAALQLSHMAISASIDHKIDQGRDDQLLKSISHIGDAAYNSWENKRHRLCLTDTRVDLLQKITDWANCNSPQYIFWLPGRAGTGKSTIALTMAQILDRHNATLASFFFKRGGGDLARSRRVISTIVYQLAMRSRLLSGFVCDALRDYPNLGDSASLSQQYEKLLLRPLQQFRQSATQSPPLIVVLDALDECDDPDDVRLLLRLLGDSKSLAGLGFRVLVTSRPETPIRLGFRDMKHIIYHELALHDVPRTVVDQDIQRFVTHELLQIQKDRLLPGSWPGEDKIRTITSRADGLFIYAATVCRYVNGPRQVSPNARLDQVCQGTTTKHKSTDILDEMYLMVLDSSMKDDFSSQEAQEVTLRLRQVVGSVILLSENLSAKELERLLFPSEFAGGVLVQDTLDSLHAIFDVPESLSKPIQMLHLSVRDFLVDRTRCPDVRFHVNQQQMHLDLFSSCLDLMKGSLQQNICHFSGPGCLVDEVSEATLSHYLTSALRYACRYWITHAVYGQSSLSDDGPVHDFLRQCCPYWLEVMGLIRRVPEAITIMMKLDSLIDEKKAPALQSLVRDTLRFIQTFSHMLSKAPLQLYFAGVAFSPFRSTWRKSLGLQAPADIKIVTQVPDEWNACIQTLEGHSDQVHSVVFSPDGSRVASSSRDKTVRIWDAQTGQCQYTLEGHSGSVFCVVFSPDGSRVASGSDDMTVRVWDVQTGQCQHTFRGHSGSVNSAVFSPDGSRVVSGSSDNTARVWDVQTGRCQHTLKDHLTAEHTLKGYLASVDSVVFSPDGLRVISSSNDMTVRVWDVQTGQCQRTLKGHSDGVPSVVFSPDGSRVVSGSWDKTVRVWDVQTGQYQHTLEDHLSRVNSVVFSPDGSRVASGSDDKTVRVWDVRTGKCEHTLEGHLQRVTSVVFSLDGSRLASWSWDDTVRVWDVQTGQCQHTFKGHLGSVNSAVFSPDGSRVVSGSSDSTVRVWDVQTGQRQHTFKGHSGSVNSAVFSPDVSQLASGLPNKTVQVCDVQTGQCEHTLQGHSGSVFSMVFSPDGSRVVSRSTDKTMRAWDAQTGQCQHTFEGHSDSAHSVVFSPDGSQVASDSKDGTVRVWDAQTGRCQHTLRCHHTLKDHLTAEHTFKRHPGSIFSVVFSPDGSRVASGSEDRKVRVWDVQTGQCERTLKGHSGLVSSVVFSPDGLRLASCSGWGTLPIGTLQPPPDKTVRVWDVQTGQCEHTLEGHSGSVCSVAFSPDGLRVVSSSIDMTVRVWDVQTGQCERTLKGLSGQDSSVVFSPDGSQVASDSEDGMVRVWDIASSTEIFSYDTGTSIKQFEFSTDSSQILVDGKWLSLPLQTLSLDGTATSPRPASGLPVSTLRFSDDWVTSSSDRILWLPPEYRPRNWTSYGDTIVLGSATGRVTFVRCVATGSLSSS